MGCEMFVILKLQSTKASAWKKSLSFPPINSNNMSDPRFARLHTDPRFVRPKASKSKIVVDDRFKQLFQDQEGVLPSTSLRQLSKLI